jgi:hypothetical protein
MTSIQNLINLDDCWLVLYSDDNETIIYNTKPIMIITDKEGNSLDFYGVKASMYGIRVPSYVTKWSICRISNDVNEILYSGSIPEPRSIHEIPIENNVDIVFTRYNEYLKFSIGITYSQRKKRNAPPSSFSVVRF